MLRLALEPSALLSKDEDIPSQIPFVDRNPDIAVVQVRRPQGLRAHYLSPVDVKTIERLGLKRGRCDWRHVSSCFVLVP